MITLRIIMSRSASGIRLRNASVLSCVPYKRDDRQFLGFSMKQLAKALQDAVLRTMTARSVPPDQRRRAPRYAPEQPHSTAPCSPLAPSRFFLCCRASARHLSPSPFIQQDIVPAVSPSHLPPSTHHLSSASSHNSPTPTAEDHQQGADSYDLHHPLLGRTLPLRRDD